MAENIASAFIASDDGTTTEIGVWVDSGGETITDVDSISIVLYDLNGNQIADLGTQTDCTNEGVFRFTVSSELLSSNNNSYYINIAMEIKNSTYVTNYPGLMSNVSIEISEYNNAVTVDVYSGNNGIVFPVGTLRKPVDNWQDAVIIANNRNFKDINLISSATLTTGDDISNMCISGINSILTTLTIESGAIVDNCEFSDIFITGTFSGSIILNNCFVSDANICGIANSCIFSGTIYPEGTVLARGSYLSDQVIFDFSFDDMASVQLSVDDGSLKIDNMNTSNMMQIKLSGGIITVDGSCTGGTIVIIGYGGLVDNSSGSVTIINNIYKGIADSVFDEELSDHIITGTFGLLLQKILGLSQENIFIDNTIYDESGQLINSRVRVFDTKEHCDAASDGGSETTGLIATYDQETVWTAVNLFRTYRQTLV